MGWFPIDPRLDPTTGAFAVFRGEKDADDFTPAPYNQEPLTNFYAQEDSFSMHVAAALGVTPAVNLSASYNSFALTYDAMLYVETNAPGATSKIASTRWGAGFRLVIQLWDVDASFKLSLGVVAAGVELGMVNASYDIFGYGFSNPEILSQLPGPGRFDRATVGRVLGAANALQAYLKANAGNSSITPVPFQVLMSTPQLDTPLDAVQATVFAMRQIAAGHPLAEALSRNASGLDAEAVRSTYGKMVKSPSGAPTSGEVAYAGNWLSYKQT